MHPQTSGGKEVSSSSFALPVRHAHYPLLHCSLGIVVSVRQGLDTIVAKVPFVVETGQSNFPNVVRKHFVLVRSNAVH